MNANEPAAPGSKFRDYIARITGKVPAGTGPVNLPPVAVFPQFDPAEVPHRFDTALADLHGPTEKIGEALFVALAEGLAKAQAVAFAELQFELHDTLAAIAEGKPVRVPRMETYIARVLVELETEIRRVRESLPPTGTP